MALDSEQKLVDYNTENIFENIYQTEKHLQDSIKEASEINGSHCIQKHLRMIRGEANEALEHAAKFDIAMSQGFSEFSRNIESLRREILEGAEARVVLTKLRDIRNRFRQIVKDPTLNGCKNSVCRFDQLDTPSAKTVKIKKKLSVKECIKQRGVRHTYECVKEYGT